jgi:hypothetical protein
MENNIDTKSKKTSKKTITDNFESDNDNDVKIKSKKTSKKTAKKCTESEINNEEDNICE